MYRGSGGPRLTTFVAQEVPELMNVKTQFMLKFPQAFGIDPRTGTRSYYV